MLRLWSSIDRSARSTRPAVASCVGCAKRCENWSRLNHEPETANKCVRPESTRVVLERPFEQCGGTRVFFASEYVRELPPRSPAASGGAGSLDGSGTAAQAGGIHS